MAVNGNLLVYPGQELTPQDFAIMMERISVIKSGILNGCVISFSETEENTLNVTEGYAFIRGRLVKINQGTLDTSSLSTSVTSWFVYARVHLDDLTEVQDLCTVFVTDTAETDATETFNENNSGIAYATLATITVSNHEIKQVTTPEIGAVEPFLITANSWDNSNTNVYTTSIQDPRITTDVHLDLIPRMAEQSVAYIGVLQRANIQVYSVSEGELKLGCYGVKPEVDLEIGIIFRGAL